MDLIFAGAAVVGFAWPFLALRARVHHVEQRGVWAGPALDGLVFATLAFGVEVYAGLSPLLRALLWFVSGALVAVVSRRQRRDDRLARMLATTVLVGALVIGLELPWQTKPRLHLALGWLACVSMVELLRHRLISLPASRSAVVWAIALGSTVVLWASSNSLRWFVTSATVQQGTLLRLLEPVPVVEAPSERLVASLEAKLESPAAPQGVQGRGPAFDVVFLGVDAWRADHADALHRTRRALGSHYEFSRAVAPAPRTVFSLAAMTRGRRVSEIDFDGGVEAGGPRTLGHELVAAGFGSVFIPSHRYLDEPMGLAEGFETVHPPDFERVHGRMDGHRGVIPARDVLGTALELGQTRDEPLLLWTHLMEAHFPYRYEGGHGPSDRQGYARALDELDAQIAAFIADFEASRPRPVLWVLFGDHGEAFGERGMHKHSTSLFDDQVRVSAWLRVPGLDGRRIDAPTGTASFASTVAELVLGRAPSSMTAPGLLSCLLDNRGCPQMAVSELPAFGSTLNELVAYTGAEQRWIINLGSQSIYLGGDAN